MDSSSPTVVSVVNTILDFMEFARRVIQPDHETFGHDSQERQRHLLDKLNAFDRSLSNSLRTGISCLTEVEGSVELLRYQCSIIVANFKLIFDFSGKIDNDAVNSHQNGPKIDTPTFSGTLSQLSTELENEILPLLK